MADEKKFVPSCRIYSPDDLGKKWFVSYSKGGKRVRVYGDINQADTHHERMRRARALKMELEQTGPARRTVEEQLWGFLEDHRGLWRKKTYYVYSSKVRIFLAFLRGRPLSKQVVEEFFIDLSKRRHKTTYNTYRRTLLTIFTGIGRAEVIGSIKKLKNTETPAKYFQEHQVRRLREFISERDPDLWFFCQFVYYCFLRPNSELRLLRVGDIDFDRWVIRVPAQVSKNGKNQYVTIPVPFRARVMQELGRRAPQEYIFPGVHDNTKPVGVNTMSTRHRNILRSMGFGKAYKLYSWKHTGAVACVRAGISVKELQIQLRHHSLEMVDKYLRQLGVHDLEYLEQNFPAI